MKNFSICIFLFVSIYSFAQEKNYRFSHINIEDGLSHPNILSVFEDSRGYLWIGTEDGLNKYDGSNITTYQPSISDTNSISNPTIKSIVEDGNGNLWFGTGDGLTLYKQKEDRFYTFDKVGDCENCLAGMVIRAMHLDGDKIWLGTNAGLSVIDINTYEIQTWWYDEDTDVVEYILAIREIISTEDGRLLMATDEGLVIFDPSKNEYSYFDEKGGLQTRGLGGVFMDSEGVYWLASDRDGIYHIEGNLDSPTFIHHPELVPNGAQRTTVYDFIEHNDELWIATHLGLTILDRNSGNVHFLQHLVDDQNSISYTTVEIFFKDSQNRIWIGSSGGLNVFDPYFNQFELIYHKKDVPKSIGGTSVTAIFEDSKGFLWYGTQDAGLTIVERIEGGKEMYYHIRKGKGSKDLKGHEVYSIQEDKQGRIWVSIPQGLHVINWENRKSFDYDIEIIETGPIEDNKLPTSSIYQLYNDETNKMWMATHGHGIVSRDGEGTYRQYKYVDQNPNRTSLDYVITLAEDENGRIWLGNFNLCGGIIKDPENEDSFKRITGDSVLLSKNINDFLFTNNRVVVSTNSGIFCFEDIDELLSTSNPEFVRFMEPDGMSDDFGNVLIPQDDQFVWVSTVDGISRIDINNNKVKSFKNSLPSSDRHFNHNVGIMTTDSFIYYGCTSGALRFNPYLLEENNERPKVYFKNLKILNEKVPINSQSDKKRTTIPVETSYLKKLELYPRDKIFSLEMEVVNFRNDSNSELQYKLEGFDKEWQTTDNPLITRSNLSEGKYTLIARAAAADGLWSDEAVLDIVVHCPWWKSWWAFLLYLLLLVGLIQFIVQLKLQRERLIVKIKNDEREKFRIESSKDFHDEAGTKITRISLLTEILKKKISANQEVDDLLSKIEQNLKGLNIGMRDFIWGLNVENDNLLETILRFTEFAHLFCEEANIKFKARPIDSRLKGIKLEMAKRRHILLILKEGLNNSVRHGNPSEIELNCVVDSARAKIILKDNGRGFDKNNITKGYGLENMNFRANAIGAKLSISSALNEGSEIILDLDLSE